MKLNNVVCFLLGTAILINSNLLVSCEDISKKYDRFKNKSFYDFLEDNGITPIDDAENIKRTYYEAEVAEHDKDYNGEIVVDTHWERLDRIDNVICQAREFDYDYKVLSVTDEDGYYDIEEKIIDDIDDRPAGYDYIYEDDYLITNGYRDVLINYGKVLKRE